LTDLKGEKTDFELVLLGPPEGKNINHVRDELGRKITLKTSGNYTLKRIEPYYVEETFKHKNSETYYEFKEFAKTFLLKDEAPKVFMAITNKMVMEYMDSEEVHLFILKTEDDATRLIESVQEFCYSGGIHDHLFFPYTSIETRKQIYDKLEKSLGVTRSYLQKVSTR
jgi:hypothetical protein